MAKIDVNDVMNLNRKRKSRFEAADAIIDPETQRYSEPVAATEVPKKPKPEPKKVRSYSLSNSDLDFIHGIKLKVMSQGVECSSSSVLRAIIAKSALGDYSNEDLIELVKSMG